MGEGNVCLLYGVTEMWRAGVQTRGRCACVGGELSPCSALTLLKCLLWAAGCDLGLPASFPNACRGKFSSSTHICMLHARWEVGTKLAACTRAANIPILILLGYPGVQWGVQWLYAPLCLHASSLQGECVASPAQGWAGCCAALTCPRSCFLLLFIIIINTFFSSFSPFQLCPCCLVSLAVGAVVG